MFLLISIPIQMTFPIYIRSSHWPSLLQWSCPLLPSITKLPVIPNLSCAYMFSISSISNTPFSTITTYFSSSLSLISQLQHFFNSSRIYNPLVLYLSLSFAPLASLFMELKFCDQSLQSCPFIPSSLSLLLHHTCLVKTSIRVTPNSPPTPATSMQLNVTTKNKSCLALL